MPSHVLNGEEYESGGWFGEKRTASTGTYAESLFGDEVLAQSLRLDRAASPATGTSALLLGFFEPDEDDDRPLEDIAEEILRSSERWFWPSMMGPKPSLEVEVTVERDGKVILQQVSDPAPLWDPFIRARQEAVTGAKAKMSGEIAEAKIPFTVPVRVSPPSQRHAQIEASLALRVGRGSDADADHERANCIAVFRGFEMVVEYVASKRKPLDEVPFFGVLMAGLAAGSGSDAQSVEEFFRSAEPPLHNDWEYTEAVKHSYKPGAKAKLSTLWAELQTKVFLMIEEDVTPAEKGPELLSKMFPIGHSTKTKPPKRRIHTEILSHDYLGGKWKITGEVNHHPEDGAQARPWQARIGFVAETDSGPGEYLQVTKLTTNKKAAVVSSMGPPAEIDVSAGTQSFTFEALVAAAGSLEKRDLDLTAIRLAS